MPSYVVEYGPLTRFLLQMNLGGAKDRPDLSQVWDNVQAKLAGKPAVHDKYSLTTMAVGLKQKIFGW